MGWCRIDRLRRVQVILEDGIDTCECFARFRDVGGCRSGAKQERLGNFSRGDFSD